MIRTKNHIGTVYHVPIFIILMFSVCTPISATPHGASDSESFCIGYLDVAIEEKRALSKLALHLPTLKKMRQDMNNRVRAGGIIYGEKLLYNLGFKAAKEAYEDNQTSEIDDTIRVCVRAKPHPREVEVNQIFYLAGMDSYFAKACKLGLIKNTNIRDVFEEYAKSTSHKRYFTQRMHDFDSGVMDATNIVLTHGIRSVLAISASDCKQLDESLRKRLEIISKTPEAAINAPQQGAKNK